VEKSQLLAGSRVAYREKRPIESPLIEVEVIDGVLRDRQIKVLFVDGEREGLRSWVRTQQLSAPGETVRQFLREGAAARAVVRECGGQAEHERLLARKTPS
jgi:hypothetical protein